ncbi:MAG: hypothetical protein BGO07_00195 [Alphaproteobacteria bacterium 40-19]|nr:MAG: hypothetical protein BGO07_00195 [Alphaproteobacteria bacterium 40-19]
MVFALVPRKICLKHILIQNQFFFQVKGFIIEIFNEIFSFFIRLNETYSKLWYLKRQKYSLFLSAFGHQSVKAFTKIF